MCFPYVVNYDSISRHALSALYQLQADRLEHARFENGDQ